MIHRTKPDCLTWKPHSGEFRNSSVVKTTSLLQPLMEVQRNQDVSQSRVMTGRSAEIHLPGQEASWGEVPQGRKSCQLRWNWLQLQHGLPGGASQLHGDWPQWSGLVTTQVPYSSHDKVPLTAFSAKTQISKIKKSKGAGFRLNVLGKNLLCLVQLLVVPRKLWYSLDGVCALSW